MRRLHRLLHHRYKVLTQGVQVNLFAQGGVEVRDDFGCIVFATVEAPDVLLPFHTLNKPHLNR
jgi:hypothetical protein